MLTKLSRLQEKKTEEIRRYHGSCAVVLIGKIFISVSRPQTGFNPTTAPYLRFYGI